jgi:predicted RNase H-like HicB family nuclease
MEIPVLLEPIPGQGFRATGGEPFGFSAEGPTREEALRKLRDLIESRLVAGTEIVPMELPTTEHPWKPFAGMFADDPLFDSWQQAIAERRHKVDEDPEVR